MLPIPEDTTHLAALLADAGRTLMAQSVRGVRPADMRSFWPAVLHDPQEAYGYDEADASVPQPNARAVTKMDSAHGWVSLIPLDPARPGAADRWSTHGGAQLRRIVLLRSLTNPRTGKPVWSWRKLGDKLHCSHEAIRQWHAQGLSVILRQLHRRQRPPSAAPIPFRRPAAPIPDRVAA